MPEGCLNELISSEYLAKNKKLGIKCYAKQMGETIKSCRHKKAVEMMKSMNQKSVKNSNQ